MVKLFTRNGSNKSTRKAKATGTPVSPPKLGNVLKPHVAEVLCVGTNCVTQDKYERCVRWLELILGGGHAVKTPVLVKMAREQGFGSEVLKKAKQVKNVQTYRIGKDHYSKIG